VGHEPFFSHSLNRFVYGPFDGFRILAFHLLPNPVQGFQVAFLPKSVNKKGIVVLPAIFFSSMK